MTRPCGGFPANRQDLQARVRPAEQADSMALGYIHVRAWQAGYRGIMPDEFLDGLDPVQRGQAWSRRLNGSSNETSTLVICAESGTPVGFATVGPLRDAAATDQGLGELFAINLDPDAWGLGLGRTLLRAATAELGRLGFREAILWVVSGNTRARRFYEAAGWIADGRAKIDDSHGTSVEELRYHCVLRPGGLPANRHRSDVQVAEPPPMKRFDND